MGYIGYIKEALREVNCELRKEPSRELSIVKTKLEEAWLWANESQDQYLKEFYKHN